GFEFSSFFQFRPTAPRAKAGATHLKQHDASPRSAYYLNCIITFQEQQLRILHFDNNDNALLTLRRTKLRNMQLKLAPVLALALPALVFGAADANIRGSQESYTSIRELSSDSTNEETTTLSGGTWLFYVMLNTLMYPVDASGHGCNSAHYSSSTTTGKGDGHSTSWANDGHTRLLENAWNGDSYSYSGNSWGGDSHQTTSSSSKPPRCEAPHAPKPKPKPKKSSSSSSHSWGGDNWGSDAWGSDAWENDGHTSSSYTSSQLAYNDDSGGSGAIAGAFVSLMVAVVAAALVAKKVSLHLCPNF
ncbi:hypothetical protein ACHAXM_003647, partial [Skeletonema potamos]